MITPDSPQSLGERLGGEPSRETHQLILFFSYTNKIRHEDAEMADLLMMCAIPPTFDHEVIGILRQTADEIDQNLELMAKLAALVFVHQRKHEGFSYDSDLRADLLGWWKESEVRRTEFYAIAQRLTKYYIIEWNFAYRNRDWIDAIRIASAGLDLNWEKQHFEQRLAATYLAAGAGQSVVQIYSDLPKHADQRLAAINEELEEARLRLTKTHSEAENFHVVQHILDLEEKRSELETYEQIRPREYFYRALAYEELEQYEAALVDYKQALDYKLDIAEAAHNNRGNIYIKTGRYDEAIREYNRALKIKPTLIEAHVNLGLAHAALEEYYQAIEQYTLVIEYHENQNSHEFVVAVYNRGVAKLKLQKYSEAIQDFDSAIQIEQFAEVFSRRGLAYSYCGEYDVAIKNYEAAVNIDPYDFAAFNNWGIACRHLEKFESALEKYNEALTLNPKLAESYNNRGNIYALQYDYDQARIDYQKAIQYNPQMTEAKHNRDLLTSFNFNRASRQTQSSRFQEKAI